MNHTELNLTVARASVGIRQDLHLPTKQKAVSVYRMCHLSGLSLMMSGILKYKNYIIIIYLYGGKPIIICRLSFSIVPSGVALNPIYLIHKKYSLCSFCREVVTAPQSM